MEAKIFKNGGSQAVRLPKAYRFSVDTIQIKETPMGLLLISDVENFWDNCVFFFFQKAPIYTLSYGAMLGLFYMVKTNQNLAIEILNLQNQVKVDGPQALSIKIGKKNKIIPIADIVWIEAYDLTINVSNDGYPFRTTIFTLKFFKHSCQHFIKYLEDLATTA